jgi:hypothetical protein
MKGNWSQLCPSQIPLSEWRKKGHGVLPQLLQKKAQEHWLYELLKVVCKSLKGSKVNVLVPKRHLLKG